jgi:hypothetical protein
MLYGSFPTAPLPTPDTCLTSQNIKWNVARCGSLVKYAVVVKSVAQDPLKAQMYLSGACFLVPRPPPVLHLLINQ